MMHLNNNIQYTLIYIMACVGAGKSDQPPHSQLGGSVGMKNINKIMQNINQNIA